MTSTWHTFLFCGRQFYVLIFHFTWFHSIRKTLCLGNHRFVVTSTCIPALVYWLVQFHSFHLLTHCYLFHMESPLQDNGEKFISLLRAIGAYAEGFSPEHIIRRAVHLWNKLWVRLWFSHFFETASWNFAARRWFCILWFWKSIFISYNPEMGKTKWYCSNCLSCLSLLDLEIYFWLNSR